MSNTYYGPGGTILDAGLVSPQGGQRVEAQAELQDGEVIWIATQHGHGDGKVTYRDYEGNIFPLSAIKKWI